MKGGEWVKSGGGGQSFFFFNDTATTEIYTLSLHDALPIFYGGRLSTSDREILYVSDRRYMNFVKRSLYESMQIGRAHV